MGGSALPARSPIDCGDSDTKAQGEVMTLIGSGGHVFDGHLSVDINPALNEFEYNNVG